MVMDYGLEPSEDILDIEPVEPANAYDDIPKPKIEDLEKELTRLIMRDKRRDDELYKNRRVVQISDTISLGLDRGDFDEDDLRGKVVRLSLPSTIVRESARLIGRQEPLITVAANDDTTEAETAAQKPEAFLHWFDIKTQQQFAAAGGQDTMRIVRAKYATRDGRLVEILTLDPECPDFPFQLRIVDPAEIHATYCKTGPDHVYRCVTMTSREIREEWGKDAVPDHESDDSMHDIVGYYDRKWLAVLLDGKTFLKKPVEHGYPCHPVIITHFNGNPGAIMEANGQTAEDLEEAFRGTGVFWDHVDEYTEYVRVISAQIYDTIYNTDPAVAKTLPPGNRNFDVDVAPGEEIAVPNGGKVDFVYRNGGLPHAQQAGELLGGLIRSGTLPIGEADFTSGFDRMVASQKGQSFFIPIIEGLRGHYERIYRAALEMFRDNGAPITITSRGKSGRPFKWAFVTQMIDDDPIVSVEFGDLGQIDRWNALQAATPALAAGVIDPYTFWHDWMRLPNAQQILDRTQKWKSRSDPVVAQQLAEVDMVIELKARLLEAQRSGDMMLQGMITFKLALIEQQMQTAMQNLMMQQMNPGMPQQPMAPDPGGMPSGPPPPPVPIPGMGGGNGTQGLPGQPELAYGGPGASIDQRTGRGY